MVSRIIGIAKTLIRMPWITWKIARNWSEYMEWAEQTAYCPECFPMQGIYCNEHGAELAEITGVEVDNS